MWMADLAQIFHFNFMHYYHMMSNRVPKSLSFSKIKRKSPKDRAPLGTLRGAERRKMHFGK